LYLTGGYLGVGLEVDMSFKQIHTNLYKFAKKKYNRYELP